MDFSDIYQTYLNTKSREFAKTSEVNNLDITPKDSVFTSPSPHNANVNVKEMSDEAKTTEGTETFSVLGRSVKNSGKITTRKVDLLTKDSSIGGSNSEGFTPKVSNVEYFTDDSSQGFRC